MRSTTSNSYFSVMTLAELQEATKADKTLQHLIQMIRTGDWSKISLPDDVDKTQLKQLQSSGDRT